MKAKLKTTADIVTYALTIITPLLAVFKFFEPGRDQDALVRFILFAVMSAIPELLCITVLVWAIRLYIRKRHLFWNALGWPMVSQQWKPWHRWVVGGILAAAGLFAIILACFQGALFTRARCRFYLSCFQSAYEQLTERQHLFASVTWQSDKAAKSAKNLLETHPERPDEFFLSNRMRGYGGFDKYCFELNKAASSFRRQTGGDHRLAVDYYCELLSLAPLNVAARGQLRALRDEVGSNEVKVRALYQAAKNRDDPRMKSLFGEVKGYLFENDISRRLEGFLIGSTGSRVPSELRDYLLSFSKEDKLIEHMRASWRLGLTDSVIKQSEDFEHLARRRPASWSDLGRLLLQYNHAAYSRAVFNSLSGLRSLNKAEEKLRIRAFLDSKQREKALSACREYLRVHPIDDEIRLATAASIVPDDRKKAGEVVDLLIPFGTIPQTHAEEILELRVAARRALTDFSTARLDAFNWFDADRHSLKALLALGTCEVEVPQTERLQRLINILTAFSANHISINHADNDEPRKAIELLASIAGEIAPRVSSLTASEKDALSLSLRTLLDWLGVELNDHGRVITAFAEIGEAIDPVNPVFKLWRAEYWASGSEIAETVAAVQKWRLEDFPLEFRYRIQEVQRQLAARILSANVPAGQSSDIGPEEDDQNNDPSSSKNDGPLKRIQIFDTPEEKVFEFGYDQYAAPSLDAPKINSVTRKSSVVVAGRLDVNGTLFFVSEWSLNRFREGHKDGTYLKAIESAPSASAVKPYPGLTILPEIKERSFVRGYQVFDAPSKRSKLVKSHETNSCRIAAYLDTGEGRFYLSDYSLERYRKGLAPFWIREID